MEVSGAPVAGVFDPGWDRFAVPGLKEAGYSASCPHASFGIAEF